ncbi:MAG: DUF1727 domain-containing protein [Clostridia bacterium]|nr:DUF1727 domain-containing protein [Clostridia bacterium]
MSIRAVAAIAASKITKKFLRLLGRGGTTLPGRVAIKICPELLGHLAKNVQCVVITGTNGKTTSARIVEEMFSEAGLSFFANRSGANLMTGVATEFIDHCTVTGKPKNDWAIVEADEAASKEICRLLDPEIILVTNVFRDQLDRYGEVTHTLGNIITGIKNSPHAKICLNADCSLSVSIADKIKNEVFFYGVDVPIYKNPVKEVSDAPHCIRCKHEYEYSYHTFGHLGGFYCPECGYRRPDPDFSVTEIISCFVDSTIIKVNYSGETEQVRINLPGGYNIYNAAGALAVAQVMELDRSTAINAVANFSCGFGRMEQFDLGDTKARMILVKNPAGCNQVLNYVTNLTEKAIFVCCLNDRLADGTDVSWIWDVNFEKLAEMGDTLDGVYVSGVRAYDMALRLKYAGIPEDRLWVFADYDTLISAMRSQKYPIVIMPTYTAMMDLREKMSAAFGGGEFWE